MIWVHCGDDETLASSRSLILRLAEQNAGFGILVTGQPEVLENLGPLPVEAIKDQLPTDSPTRARGFLDHYKPRYLIWNGGPLRPALLRSVYASSIPATFLNARIAGIIAGSSRWVPGALRTAVKAFDTILTADGATATRLRRGGMPAETVRATGPILEDPIPLPHDANELTVMAEALEARPVWYAANVSLAEVEQVTKAHLIASRKSHRMLLLLTPQDLEAGPKAARVLRTAGLKTGVRSEGDDPTADMQAYVADVPNEVGLWYRIAPLTFIGGTLRGGDVASPFDPIILGSGVVHGTQKSTQGVRFARLASVEACREIRSASELGIAVGALLSPEQTARMALAGWEEITRSAETINSVIETALSHAVGERPAL